ncbi:hypothetical protein REPUB_Repub11eG0000400 [Reevesia pubescens]
MVVESIFKINVGSANCSGVLRDVGGNIIAIFSGPLVCCVANLAEVITIKTTLKVFLEANFLVKGKLLVESDSLNAINWCSNPVQRPWRLWELFCQIDALVSKIGEVDSLKIFREANEIVDKLAKDGMRRACLFKAWW